MHIHKGDYVLATKYDDGDPKDPWCIGFYVGLTSHGRHLVSDDNGNFFRASGYRRVEIISNECGDFMIKYMNLIEESCYSIWWWRKNWKQIKHDLDVITKG